MFVFLSLSALSLNVDSETLELSSSARPHSACSPGYPTQAVDRQTNARQISKPALESSISLTYVSGVAVHDKRARASQQLFATLALLALAVVVVMAAGALVYREQERAMREEAKRDLSSIAAVTAQQIQNWREDQLTDGVLLADDLAPEISRLLTAPSTSTRDELELSVRHAATMHAYATVLIVSPAGDRIAKYGMAEVPADLLSEPLARAFRLRDPIVFDYHSADFTSPQLVVVAAVPASPDAASTNEPQAALVLFSSLADLLGPIVRSWSASMDTGELVLVRADGNEAVILSDPRPVPETAPGDTGGARTAARPHVPLDQVDSPAAAAAGGFAGFMNGVDYRGHAVAAVTMPIAGSPWSLVVKMDAAEAYAEWRSRSAFLIALVAGVAVLLTGLGFTLWFHRRKAHYKELFVVERMLREQNERQSVTLRSIGDAVISTDSDGHVELLNPVAESLTGWKADEAAGRPVAEVFRIVHALTGEPAEIPVERVLRDGVVVGLANHTALIARDGSVYQIADAAAPIRDSDGEVTGVVLVFRDVTEGYRVQRALAESEARLRAAARNLEGVLYILDADLRFMLSLGTRLAALGLEENEVVGTTLYDFLATDDPDHPLVARHRAALTGEVVSMESAHGGVTFLTTLSPLTGDDGTVTGIVGLALDITDRREMEERVRDALDEKTQLLRELYHRTKNNMQVITSMLTLQAGRSESDEVRAVLAENTARIRSMALVHEMLYQSNDLSRINLAEYLRRLVAAVAETYYDASGRVRMSVDAADIPVLIDTAVPCGMVVSELLSNAFKHAFPEGESGEVSIKLRHDAGKTATGSIVLRVADNGVGLPDGLDVRTAESIGIQTMTMIVEHQLQGSISFDGHEGTRCEIRFSDDQYRERV